MFGFILSLLLLSTALYTDSQCPLTLSNGSDRRTHHDKLSIMQYNVEWAFIDYSRINIITCLTNGWVL